MQSADSSENTRDPLDLHAISDLKLTDVRKETDSLGEVGVQDRSKAFRHPIEAMTDFETAIIIELRGRYVDRPLREGAVGWLTRAGAALAGPTSLLLRMFSGHSSVARYIAAVRFVIGALISRYAWIAAGRVSSRDPQALFRIQRPGPNPVAHQALS
jgi:hypothetical protein